MLLGIVALVLAPISTGAALNGTPSRSVYMQPVNNAEGNLSDLQPSYGVEEYGNVSNAAGFGIQTAYSKPVVPLASFTPGNLVIYRVGDGAAALSSAATAVFLDEYTTAGAFVQSVGLPTAVSGSNKRLTASGTATSEGGIARSIDGAFLTLAGYDAALGTASITTSASSTINRVIGRVGSTGAVDTTTALTDAISGGNPRSATSTNGTDLWISGTSSGGGIRYATFGATTSTALNTATVTNLRHANIFGGQLYVSSQSGAFRLATVGTGTPTTGGQTITNLPGYPTATTSPYGFFFADLNAGVAGVDTLYVADDNGAGGTGGIQKYSLVSGSWVSNGSISSTAGLRGLTGVVNGNNVTLYVTSGSSLFTLTDTTGYNATISGSLGSIASAGTNTAFRGIAFAPVPANAAIITNCPTPLNVTFGVGGSVSVSASDADGTVTGASITNITPSDPGTITLTDFTPASGVGGTANATLNAGASTPPGNYNVTITWSNNDAMPQTSPCTVAVMVIASAPVVPTCPGNLNAPAGTTASTGVSATDADGTVTSASITNITPSNPGTITLTDFTPAPGVGGTANATLNVGNSTPPGNYSVTITWSNNDSTPQTATCTVTVAVFTPIHTIQGSGNTSPFAGQIVTTSGIVTGVKSNGFFIQAADADVDANPSTSEGVFVFTSSAPPAAAVVGNSVAVMGTVQEFIPSQDLNSPPATEIAGSLMVTLLSTGNPLPAAVTLTAADTSPTGSIQQLERFEGMRVHVNSLTVIAPTQGTINEANATSVSNGIFYGVITGVARPFREPGLETPDPAPAGSPCCIPRFDANPERLRVDSDGLTGGVKLDVTTFVTVTNLTGPLDYAFRTYTILQDPPPAPQPGVSANISAIPVPVPDADEFTVGSFNMERFFDTTDDPTVQDVVLTATAFNNRLNKASLAIRNVMRTPDVIGIEEMENLTTLQMVATKINNDAVAAMQPNPNYQAYLVEGNDIGGIDVGFLVKAARVTVIDVTQFGKDTTYIDPNNGQPALLNDRPSLVLRATVTDTSSPQHGAVPTFPITVIVNHLRSLSGVDDPVDGNRVRTKRRAQAEYLANLIQSRQTADPSERIVSVGDYNAFQFNDGYGDSIGTIKGTPTPPSEVVLASSDLVNPNLIDLLDTVPHDQQYSFSFDGNAQVLDHELVNSSLLPYFNRIAYARNNGDFPESFRNDPNRPERISDHDMAVAFFKFMPVPCSFTLSSTIQPFTAAGGDGSVTVTAGPACNWTVMSNDGWVIITSAASATGSATITFEVKENMSDMPRTGTLTVAGQFFIVSQDGAAVACSYSISPTSQSFKTPGAGGGTINVTATGECGWVATSRAGWITITSGTHGVGSGTVNYTVAVNPGGTRTGTITVAGQVFTVKQKGN
ncbi:MAG TPA: BACON domain-containing carbohydrate-binding protein [Blastocatellia bacterium]|nr:BACON domain-containing carbohydrate-binding protein [Blastocatellia bacterium]